MSARVTLASALGLVVLTTATAASSGCNCEASSAATEATLLEWGAERHHIAGLTEGDTEGEDLIYRSAVNWTPQPLTGALDPELLPLRLQVIHSVGTRRMSTPSGSFTAAVPLAVTMSVLDEGRWRIEPRCDDPISAPIPRILEDGSGAYADGATFWLRCQLHLQRAELEYTLHLQIYGDGRLEGRASSGAVTVTSAR